MKWNHVQTINCIRKMSQKKNLIRIDLIQNIFSITRSIGIQIEQTYHIDFSSNTLVIGVVCLYVLIAGVQTKKYKSKRNLHFECKYRPQFRVCSIKSSILLYCIFNNTYISLFIQSYTKYKYKIYYTYLYAYIWSTYMM